MYQSLERWRRDGAAVPVEVLDEASKQQAPGAKNGKTKRKISLKGVQKKQNKKQKTKNESVPKKDES